MEVVFVIIGIVVGIVIGFLIAKAKISPLESKVSALTAQLRDSERSTESLLEQERVSSRALLEQQKKASDEMLSKMEQNHSRAMSMQQENNRDALEALQGRFDETVAKMKAELETVTSEMLKKRQTEFESASRENVSRILEPLNDNLRQMRDAVKENTDRHTAFGGQLSSNIQLVLQHSDAARKSAERLADALRGGGRIQGDWGETVLTELLESQGLEEGIHFDTQTTLRDTAGNVLKGEGGARMRPDVILHLDRHRDVIIDAKVSLSAYLDYMNAETEETRSQALRNHIVSVENHVNELARKDYSSYVHPPKLRMNYVIMFVPNTAALYTATSNKPDLWRKAMEKNVYIADEQTLYAALRIISMTWRQIAQAENHEKVFGLANEMLDRVSAFLEKFTKIGKQLDDARKSYDDAFNKLKDSGKSIPQTCRKLVSLGASVKDRKGVDPSFFSTTADEGTPYPLPESPRDPMLNSHQDL